MYNKTCIINQYEGLGDILLCEPIARSFHDKGYNIIWPTSIYLNIQKHFPYIQFVDKNKYNINYDNKQLIISDNYVYLPLRFADHILSNGGNNLTCMSDKYKLVNMSLDVWKTLTWKRDMDTERKLYYDILKLHDNEPYNLISSYFTPNRSMKININPNNGLKNINIDKINDITLLDWGYVIENASNMYIVGSSILFIIDVLHTKASVMNLYPRIPHEYDCNNYNYLFSKKYNEIL